MSFIDQTFADAFESQLSADTNTVYLEPDVVASFLRFLTKIEDSITKEAA